MRRRSTEDSKKHCQHTKKMRNDEKFNLFWKDVEKKATIFDVDPRIEECLGASAKPGFDEDISHYRKVYYESLKID